MIVRHLSSHPQRVTMETQHWDGLTEWHIISSSHPDVKMAMSERITAHFSHDILQENEVRVTSVTRSFKQIEGYVRHPYLKEVLIINY